MKVYYVYYKDLMEEKTFRNKIKKYPLSYKEKHWIKVLK